MYLSRAPTPPGRRFRGLSSVTIITEESGEGPKKGSSRVHGRALPTLVLFVPGRPAIAALHPSAAVPRILMATTFVAVNESKWR